MILIIMQESCFGILTIIDFQLKSCILMEKRKTRLQEEVVKLDGEVD